MAAGLSLLGLIWPEADRAGREDRLAEAHAAGPELVGVIHQQDGIVDHDATQHDAPDIGLNIEGGVCQQEHQNDTGGGHGDRKHHHKGVPE